MSTAMSLLPWWIGLPLLAGGCVLTLVVGFAAFRALTIVAERAWLGACHLADSMTTLFVNVTISTFAGCVGLLQMLVSLLLWPLTILWEHTAVRAHNALALKAELFRQRQQLWHQWRREFRDQFPTFGEFLEAFEGGGKRREEPQFDSEAQGGERAPPDTQETTFVAACRLFGLAESGFAAEQLNARYRALIRTMHPDKGGNNERAAALNAARDFIKQRKGWT